MSSFKQKLIENIQKHVDAFIQTVADKYNLNQSELHYLWSGENKELVNTESKKSLTTVDMNDLSIERLHKCTKLEITALCKNKGLKCTGTKEVLINRLLGKEQETTSQTKTKKTNTTTKTERKTERSDIVKKLSAQIPSIPIRTNKFGNHEHPETRLVFKNGKVYGTQNDDGSVSDLTESDIENCKKFKFNYDIPTNLDGKGNLNRVKISELAEDEQDIEIEEDEDIEIEEDVEEEDVEDVEEEDEEEEEILDE